MKSILLFFFILLINQIDAQQNQPIMDPVIKTGDSVTVIAIFNKMNVTKDGYYIGGYVVEMGAKEAKQLDGKKIKITGVLNIVKGLNSEPNHYDEKGKLIVSQGREGDTLYIVNPVITLLQE